MRVILANYKELQPSNIWYKVQIGSTCSYWVVISSPANITKYNWMKGFETNEQL